MNHRWSWGVSLYSHAEWTWGINNIIDSPDQSVPGFVEGYDFEFEKFPVTEALAQGGPLAEEELIGREPALSDKMNPGR